MVVTTVSVCLATSDALGLVHAVNAPDKIRVLYRKYHFFHYYSPLLNIVLSNEIHCLAALYFKEN